MQLSCYIEVNILCLFMSGIIFARQFMNQSINSAPRRLMRRIITALWALCISDIVAISFRGKMFSGATAIIEISNLAYIILMPLISMLWMFYVINRVNRVYTETQKLFLISPFAVFVILSLGNPYTGFFFEINEQNLYVRGPGVFVHWLVSWFYMIAAEIIVFRVIRKESSWTKRNQYNPLLTFLILPAIGCLAQMLFYGITSVQAGITLGLILVSLQMQDNQNAVDELTGIANRKAMRIHVENLVMGQTNPNLTVFMIDVNKFKAINDTLGHAVGDIALCDTANILSKACDNSSSGLFLSRYGGDEFVIIGHDIPEDETQKVISNIRELLVEFNTTQNKPYKLSLSIGYATGSCKDYENFIEYMKLADEKMYIDKGSNRR